VLILYKKTFISKRITIYLLMMIIMTLFLNKVTVIEAISMSSLFTETVTIVVFSSKKLNSKNSHDTFAVSK